MHIWAKIVVKMDSSNTLQTIGHLMWRTLGVHPKEPKLLLVSQTSLQKKSTLMTGWTISSYSREKAVLGRNLQLKESLMPQ